MSLFGKPKNTFLETNTDKNAKLNSLRYQTAQAGSVIPIVYGTMRVSPNLIAYSDFNTISAPTGGAGGGAKGGKGAGGGGAKGGGKNGGAQRATATTFTADVDFGICQGPVTILPKSAVYDGTMATTFSANPWHFYDGHDGQAADPVFVAQGDTVGYSGTCHITQTPMMLGQAPVIQNFGFEIIGFFANTSGDQTLLPGDANPGLVIADALTNLRYGAGFPAANLDDLAPGNGLNTYGDYTLAVLMAISIEMDGQTQIQQWLSGLADLTNTAIVWSNKLLKLIPYGDQPLSNGGVSWAPNLIPEYSLTDDDFLPWTAHQDGSGPSEGDDDPVVITRSNPADAVNWLTVEYLDRNNQYNPTIIPLFDQGAIDQYGLRTGDNLQGHAFANARAATAAGQARLQRLQYIRNTYKFKLGWKFCLLEPMDIVLITDKYIGLNQYPVRITSIEEDDTNGDLTIEAEQIESGIPAPPKAPPAAPPPTGAPPPAVSAATFVNLVSTTTTTSSFALTTTLPNEVAVVYITINSLSGPAPSVTSISGGGLSWARRTRTSGQAPGNAGNSFVAAEVWWAVAPAALASAPITINSNSPALAFLNGIAFAVSGVNTTAPWDPHPSLPRIANHTSGAAAQPGVSGVSTNGPGVVLWFFSEFSIIGALNGPTGFTVVPGGTTHAGSGFDPVNTDAVVYQNMTSTALVSASLDEVPGTLAVTGPVPSWIVIADALRS